MLKIVCDGLANRCDHRILNAEIKALNLEGFFGTASLIREQVDGVWVACARYVLVKTHVPIPLARVAEVTAVVTAHMTREV